MSERGMRGEDRAPSARRLVLVIEDDADTRTMVACALDLEGWDVAEAANGSEALALLRAEGARLPELILLDLRMPVMNGWEFRAEQRSDARLGDIPLLVLSGDLRTGPEAEALEADGWLRKPVDLEALSRMVGPFAAGARAPRQASAPRRSAAGRR